MRFDVPGAFLSCAYLWTCIVLWGANLIFNVYTDAFGLASMVSLVPIITVEITGLIYEFKTRLITRVENLDDSIVEYNWEV